MGRLCERPGCSEPASVAYGMRAEDLVFWLDALRADDDQSSGVLCQRHADSMIVPRHWTLDDLRDPVPRLFRAPASKAAAVSRPKRRKQVADADAEQLLLDGGVAVPSGAAGPAVEIEAVEIEPDVDLTVSDSVDIDIADIDIADIEQARPWTPTFDESDDLGGLLSARSPLLARAFRGDDRPRSG